MRLSPLNARLWGAFTLALFVGTLVVGAAFSSPAGAAEQRSTRKMSLVVTNPGTVVSGDTVTTRARARDQAGRPIKGAAVVFWWRLPNGTCSHAETTNTKGAAANSHTTDCGSAAEFHAKVVVTARWHGQVRRVTRSFTIVGGT
jgi:hypothetical protein